MRILAVTNMYPTPRWPAAGIFVNQQVVGLRQIGLDVSLVVVDRLDKGMVAYLGVSRQVRNAIAAFGPDIIHVMYGGVMADQVTRTVQHNRVVVTFHGSDLLGERAAGPVRKVIAGYGVWASWRAARRAHGVVTVSKVLQDALPKDIDRRKTRIIPCGIDLNRFTPLDQQACRARLGWNPRRFNVLFPSHAGNSVKRSELARNAIARLNHSGIDAELHYLADVSNAEVPVWLNASDALLLTSFHEGSPTIVKEALACDRPVVSVDVGDVRERIEDVPGCHIAAADPESLATKLRMVRTGPGRVDGRVKTLDLSLQSVAVRLRNFYEELLSVGQEAAEAGATGPVPETFCQANEPVPMDGQT